MINLYCDEFILQNQDSEIVVSTEVLKKKGYRNQEKRLITLFCYDKDKLGLRNSIKVAGETLDSKKLEKGSKVILRLKTEGKSNSTYILGIGTVDKIIENKEKTYYEISDLMFCKTDTKKTEFENLDEYFSKDPKDMFERFPNEEYGKKQDTEIYEKYTKGLFKIYYDMLLIEIQNNNDISSSGNKASALASYLAINNYFKQNKNINEKYELSLPNTFIQNCNVEFDAMILNKEQNDKINNETFFVNPERVKAVVEIKTSGIILSSKDDENKYDSISDEVEKKNIIIKDRFTEYITNTQKEKDRKSNYNDLLENKGEYEKRNIKYVYVAIHEKTSNDPEQSIDYYRICRQAILEQSKNKYYGIFCATSCDNTKYSYPIDYDIDETLEEVLQ